jgi:hypothetical protein
VATQVFYTGNGSTTTWNLTFPYQSKSDVKVSVDGVDTAFTWASASAVTVSPAAPSGSTVRIYRRTAYATRGTDFTDGSVLTENDLDADSIQTFYRVQEVSDQMDEVEGRSLRAPPGETLTQLPARNSRKGKFLAFDEIAGEAYPADGTAIDDYFRTTTVSLLSFLTAAEINDVTSGANTINITSKIAAAIAEAASKPGCTLDMRMLKGTVHLSFNPFAGIYSAPFRWRTGQVKFTMDFNNGSLLLPSNLTWEPEDTVVEPSVQITSILSDASPGVGLIGTSIVGTTGSGTSGQQTITVASALGLHVGAYVAVNGVKADTDIQHAINANMTASSPASFGFSSSVANTIEASTVYLLIGTEIIYGSVSGGTFTVLQRGALGTTAAAHTVGDTATLMRGYIDRITGISGTTITLASPLPRTFTGAPLRAGAVNVTINGRLTVDGKYDRLSGVTGLFSCIASVLSANFTVRGITKLYRGSHGGLILFGAANANVELDLIQETGKPSATFGSSVWVFGEALRNYTRVRLANDGNLAVAVDNKSNGVSFYGIDGAPIENRVDIDVVTAHVAEAHISGARGSRVEIGYADTSATASIIDSGVPQTTSDPLTIDNVVVVGRQKTVRASSVTVGATNHVLANGLARGMTSGAGSPEGAVTAPIGTLYLRTDGGAGTTFYVKESGTGNTGWVAK